MIWPDGVDARAGEPPDEAPSHVKEFARRPARFGDRVPPTVQKQPAIIERAGFEVMKRPPIGCYRSRHEGQTETG